MQVGVCQNMLSSGAGVPTESGLHTHMNTRINPSLRLCFFEKKKSNFSNTEPGEKDKHWSKGSNCIETNSALKAVASLRPCGHFFRSGAGTLVLVFYNTLHFFFFPVD